VLSAAIGRAAVRVFHSALHVVTTDLNLAEVYEYLPLFIETSGLPAEEVAQNLENLPLTVLGLKDYEPGLEEARRLIGGRDPDDVALLALALTREIPIWSNDRDFEALTVTAYPTAVLLKILESQESRRD